MMPRKVTLFTGQWADVKRSELVRLARDFGYGGLELACWGDHFDVLQAGEDPGYCARVREELERHDLTCTAIGAHLVGQAVLDPIDLRHQAILPAVVWGDGKPEGVNRRAAEELKATARAAQKLGASVVTGFTGSPIWRFWYAFPPVEAAVIEAGYELFAERFNPILDVFEESGVRFALEVHPGEIAFDLHSAERALAAIGRRAEFGFNFDPSHLHWQGVDPVQFLRAFPDRIYHVHIKDAAVTLDGRSGVLGSHAAFGDGKRGWNFRSPGRGGVNFEEIIRALNDIGYDGPLSVEWEDAGMDRMHGAREACEFVKRLDFAPSGRAFDAAFAQQ